MILQTFTFQNLKKKGESRGSKRRSSSSRKDGSHHRRSSSSRKEGAESRNLRDGEQSLPRKYSRHNSGESLSHARKNSRSSHTRSSESQGHSSKDDQGMERDSRGEEGMMQDGKRDEVRDDERAHFTVSVGGYIELVMGFDNFLVIMLPRINQGSPYS